MTQIAQTRQTAGLPAAKIVPGRRADDYVGERIRERRTELGLTQEELGRALKISYQQVQKYETAANRVSAGRLYELARELNVGIAYFFEGFDSAQQGVPMPHGGHNRAAIDLVRNFLEIKDEDLRASIGSLLKAVRDHQPVRS
ncbi:MAG TPA: helix-turn-helix transcriptional regulator [Rhizomicrobium sp.]|nr:helix-turn-helix transcriptional regulator [Rhizomicrobium sp.]